MRTSRAFNEHNLEQRCAYRQSVEKRSDDLFFYLCDHMVKANWRILDGITQKQKDMLAVMSFCLLGEMTFIAANLERISNCVYATAATITSLLAWLVAFCIGLFMWRKDKGFLVVPGGNERVSFLPNSDDEAKFMMEPRSRYRMVDEFMMRAYFERMKNPLDDSCDYDEVVTSFNERIRNAKDLQDFNRNAWLASLTHVFYSAEAIRDRTQEQFLAINVLFIINIVFLIVAIVICLLMA